METRGRLFWQFNSFNYLNLIIQQDLNDRFPIFKMCHTNTHILICTLRLFLLVVIICPVATGH